jgi:DNA-binding CsgD family transcriptional regulator
MHAEMLRERARERAPRRDARAAHARVRRSCQVASGGTYVNHALGRGSLGRRTANLADVQLTTREQEIVGLVARGLSNREIVEKLWVSPRTVENHRLRAMRRIGVTSRSELVHPRSRRVSPRKSPSPLGVFPHLVPGLLEMETGRLGTWAAPA